MKTDELIAALASEPMGPPLRPVRIAAAVTGLVVSCFAVFLLAAGLRADLGTALTTPVIAVKTILPALLSLLALLAVLRMMRPEGAETVRARAVLGAVLVLCLGLYAVGFTTQARPLWFADLTPAYVAQCLGFILLLSLPGLALAMRLVRRGASTAPVRSGAALGLAVSAGATAGYSLYCTQDNPIFFVTWYGAAILIVTGIGALAGHRFLRW